MIDEVAIYDRALSGDEILAAMAGMAGVVPELASAPNPADEAIDVNRDAGLGWAPGEVAVTHDVYLGTVLDDVNDASRDNPMGVLVSQGQGATTYDPDGLLDLGQTYYWRIDEVNGAPDNTIFKVETWSFTVEPFAYAVEGVVGPCRDVADRVAE